MEADQSLKGSQGKEMEFYSREQYEHQPSLVQGTSHFTLETIKMKLAKAYCQVLF